MKTLQINVYADPGHAWAKVSRNLLEKFNIADKISSYSYQRNGSVYLEEDCDLSVLIKALREHGIEPKFKEFHTNKSSKIRSYYQYYHYSKTV